MEKKKVELLVCPLVRACTNMTCSHREPHEFCWCGTECTWTGRPHGSSICIPYKLQVGDRVLILESMWDVIEDNEWFDRMKFQVGMEHVVNGHFDSYQVGSSVYFKDVDYHWPVDHLQYVGRGEKDITTTFVNCGVSSATGWPTSVDHGSLSSLAEPEYTPTGKKLPLWELIKSSKIAMHELERIIVWFKENAGNNAFLREDMFIIVGLLGYALQHSCFKAFLLDNGYIAVKEGEKKEVFYKIGQFFKSSHSGEVGRLVLESEGVIFRYNERSGAFGHHAVEDVDKITQAELDGICGEGAVRIKGTVTYEEVSQPLTTTTKRR